MVDEGPKSVMDRAKEYLMKFPEAMHVEHMGLGLYGMPLRSGVAPKLFDRVVAFFAQLGCVPTHLSSNVVTKSKWISFSRGIKRWRADSSAEKSFSLSSFPAEERDPLRSIEGQPAQRAAAMWSHDLCVASNYSLILTFCAARVGEHTKELLDLAREIAEYTAPRYGIIYSIPMAYNPLAYGIGFCMSAGCAIPAIGAWGSGVLKYGLYRYLRNVYRWNFLTDIQLNALVNGQRLEDWIKQSPRRGKLTPFVGDMTHWTVPEEDIPAARQTVDEAGLFFDYDRDINANCSKYRCSEQEAAEFLRTGKEPRYNPPDPNEPPLSMEAVLQQLGVDENDTVLRKGEDGKLHPVSPPKKRKRASDDK